MPRLLVLLSCAFAFTQANAQQRYPAKPLRVIVPFAPGGAGSSTRPSALPSEAFGEHIRGERGKWGRLLRERNIAVN